MSHGALVHIVDDEPAVRESLSRLLQASGHTTRLYDTGDSFWAALDPKVPGCVVVDVCMPGINGMVLQKLLAAKNLSIPVVILTGHADVAMAVEAMQRGAFGFLQKPPRSHELLEIVSRSVDWHTNHLRQECLRRLTTKRFEKLTERERTVLALVVKGKSSKEIGRTLGISQRTVEQHRANLMQKLEVDSLVELLQTAVPALDDSPVIPSLQPPSAK